MSTQHLADDPVLEYSALQRDVTRDGTTVSIAIYRGQHDRGWLLEIDDERGGSTVWDDTFESDDAALAEALRAIDEDGIHTFAPQSVDRATLRAQWDRVVAQPSIADLKRVLDASDDMMSFQSACGLFAAVASAPELVGPSTWLGMIRRDHAFTDLEEAQQFTNGAMALYNEVVRSVAEHDVHCCPHPGDRDAIREFCAGYVKVALSDPTWAEDTHGLAELAPLYAITEALPIEKAAELMPTGFNGVEDWLEHARQDLPETIAELHDYWDARRKVAAIRLQDRGVPARRAEPKVGRNDPCPCGSGKKFKKCCAS